MVLYAGHQDMHVRFSLRGAESSGLRSLARRARDVRRGARRAARAGEKFRHTRDPRDAAP
eukprot:1587812-Prymnesium_polylepis.3